MTDDLATLEKLTERLTGYTPNLILIVEDDPEAGRTLCDILEQQGWDCLIAANGESGIAITRESRPAVVLIDLRLPGMQGLEVAERIAEIAPATWRIVVTAYATREMAIQAVRLGLHDFLQKPVVITELMAAIEGRRDNDTEW